MHNTIIHIGFPKTATTWFQEYFFPNINDIAFVKKEIINRNIIKPNAFNFNKTETLNTLQTLASSKKLVISSERLVGTFNRGWLNGFQPKELANRLNALFPDATIIVFIRKQDDAISSAYQQYIKNGGTYSTNKYLNSSSFFLFNLDHLHYYQIIKYYCELFGRDHVKIYLFEDFKKDPMAFVQKFATEHQLDCDWDRIAFNPVNESPPKTAIPLMKFINRFYYRGYPFKQYIFPIPGTRKIASWLSKSNILGRKASNEQMLGRHNLDYITDYFRESNNSLMNNLGVKGLKENNYPL